MSTNIVTRLVCENCGYIFEPGEIGYFIEGDEEFWNSDKLTYVAKDTFHPCCCPKCQSEIKTIQVPDNAFKRLVSHSALERASAIDSINSATYVSIEESRMRFERYKRRKERRSEPIQLPIAIVVDFDGCFAYNSFLEEFMHIGKVNRTLKEIRKMVFKANGIMEYCTPGGDTLIDKSHEAAQAWSKVGLEDQCGYFDMETQNMILHIVTTSLFRSPNKYKVIFKPFYLKTQGETK